MYQKLATPRPQSAMRFGKHLISLGFAAICLWLLAQELEGLEGAALWASVQAISPLSWGIALLATALSFWALGRYDAVLHADQRTGVTPRHAALSGVVAIAASQTIGFGLITGTFARWRMLPGLSLAHAASITTLCALSFLAALGMITALMALWLGPSGAASWAVPLIIVIAALPLLSLASPEIHLPMGRRMRFPSLRAMAALFAFTLLDTGFAALAFYSLMPQTLSIDFSVLYLAFLISLGLAILSGAPAGAGPFELSLLAQLPGLPEADLIAAILAFRIVYYAAPAALAACALARPLPQTARPLSPQPDPKLFSQARRSELGIARQNGADILSSHSSVGFALRTPQTFTLLLDPAKGPISPLVPALKQAAKTSARIPALYKCSARSAARARHLGFHPMQIAREAVINPQHFTTSGPAFRQLRRKLRQAQKAGLKIFEPGALPVEAMAEVDAEWRRRTGRPRSASMGVFCPRYLRDQRIYIAAQDNEIKGFISFHISSHELCLDLMRSADSAPDGTMHMLLTQAIKEAASEGRTRLSLAALPPTGRVSQCLALAANSAGLEQFKACFAPRYEPLYIAAPNRFALAIALIDLARTIHKGNPEAHS